MAVLVFLAQALAIEIAVYEVKDCEEIKDQLNMYTTQSEYVCELVE